MNDVEHMRRALAQAATVRSTTAPNPWVGSVVVPPDSAADAGTVFAGATAPPGGPARRGRRLWPRPGRAARGATLYVTLEPCAHHGRTPPCTDAIIAAGVARVVVGIEDPDEQVAGRGIAALRAAGIDVTVGVAADEVAEQLAPYCKHRTTGQPWVVLKMAASLDGRTAAPDGTSRWITGEAARRDVHRLRARPTPSWSGRAPYGPTIPSSRSAWTTGDERRQEQHSPCAWCSGQAPADARVHPALELAGDLGDVLTELGRRGRAPAPGRGGGLAWPTISMPPGWWTATCCTWRRCSSGATTAARFSRGPGLAQLEMCGRAGSVSIEQLGEDLRVEVAA